MLDEAMGKQVSPLPFRGATSTLLAPTPSRRGKVRARVRLLGALGLAGLLGVIALYLDAAAGTELSLAAPGRATAYDNAPPPGFEEAKGPLGTPPDMGPAVEGQGFRFLRHEDNGDPVTWSPCRPIHYVMRPDNAPADADAMLLDAMARLSFATRLTLLNDGPTTEGPSEDRSAYQRERYGDRWAPVLIAWTTRAEVPDFGIDIAGEAGPSSVRTPSGDTTYVSGVVYLDPIKIEEIRREAGEAAARITLLHELGHLVGLAHVDDEAQIMFPRGNSTVVDYQVGDRAGLAALGRGPCQPDV
ncbi:MAG: hypothetical protein ACR2K2_12925 [Mycobacteriales bacterium]